MHQRRYQNHHHQNGLYPHVYPFPGIAQRLQSWQDAQLWSATARSARVYDLQRRALLPSIYCVIVPLLPQQVVGRTIRKPPNPLHFSVRDTLLPAAEPLPYDFQRPAALRFTTTPINLGEVYGDRAIDAVQAPVQKLCSPRIVRPLAGPRAERWSHSSVPRGLYPQRPPCGRPASVDLDVPDGGNSPEKAIAHPSPTCSHGLFGANEEVAPQSIQHAACDGLDSIGCEGQTFSEPAVMQQSWGMNSVVGASNLPCQRNSAHQCEEHRSRH
jgi:hypothetical protein